MCLARIEFLDDEAARPLVDIVRIEPTPTGLNVTALTGKVEQVPGEIQSVDFIESVVWIRRRGGRQEGT